MKLWTRFRVRIACGSCDHPITPGDPVLEFHLTERAVLRRCTHCAGEPVPDDLAPLAPLPEKPRVLAVPAGDDLLPIDWKLRGAGE